MALTFRPTFAACRVSCVVENVENFSIWIANCLQKILSYTFPSSSNVNKDTCNVHAMHGWDIEGYTCRVCAETARHTHTHMENNGFPFRSIRQNRWERRYDRTCTLHWSKYKCPLKYAVVTRWHMTRIRNEKYPSGMHFKFQVYFHQLIWKFYVTFLASGIQSKRWMLHSLPFRWTTISLWIRKK